MLARQCVVLECRDLYEDSQAHLRQLLKKHGWNIVAYMKRLRARYTQRRNSWALLVEAAPLPSPRSVQQRATRPDARAFAAEEATPNAPALAPGVWTTIEQLAFSSQMWFLVLAYGLGVTTTALGTVLMSRHAYNPLTDLWSTPLVLLHLLFVHALRWILTRVARKAKIWRVPPSADQGQEGSGRRAATRGHAPLGAVPFAERTQQRC